MENEYEFKRVDDTSTLFNFESGVEPIDKFIKNKERGLEKFIRLRLSNLWVVFERGEAVALFALSKDAIMLNNEDRRLPDWTAGGFFMFIQPLRTLCLDKPDGRGK